MSRTRWFGMATTAAAFVLCAAGAGFGKPLFQEDFGSPRPLQGAKIVRQGEVFGFQGMGGTRPASAGGFLSYDIGLNPEEGTIEFDLSRDEREANEVPFSLTDAEGSALVRFEIAWNHADSLGGPVRPALLLSALPRRLLYRTGVSDLGAPVTFDGALLNPLSQGKVAHFAMTWGGGGLRVYQDGKPLAALVENYAALKEALGKTRKLMLGGWQGSWLPQPKMVYGSTHSLISSFQVHDRQLKPDELGQAIVLEVGIASISHNAPKIAGFSGKLIAGDRLEAAVYGTPGAVGTFDLLHYPDIKGEIALDWRGWGVYLEEKVFFSENEIDLREVSGYRVYASTAPLEPVTAETIPAAELKVDEQSHTLDHLEADTPYYVAVYAVKRDGTFVPVIQPLAGLPLEETEPGVYAGDHVVGYQDRIARAVVVGRLARGAAAASALESNPFELGPALVLTVETSPNELKADEQSVSRITVTVADANGKPVGGHKVKFLLATTSQYTGVVGGGAFAEQVGGAVKEDVWGETDLFGRVTATYVAGFAAKTAIIVARDMTSNDTGAGWVKTFIQTRAELELLPVEPVVAAVQGYEIVVTSSDEWLTADGASQARITARVTLAGRPVAGHRLAFGVSAGAGSIRAVTGVTDGDGEARAIYTAGTKIGMVVITATDLDIDLSGSVMIELRSDAPAKIGIKITPDRLPADGRSSAVLLVTVTDVNDNPNDNVEVECRIASGSGRLSEDRTVTDKNGESRTAYVAGSTPGTVGIEITVRSAVPTAEELAEARGLALGVNDSDFF